MLTDEETLLLRDELLLLIDYMETVTLDDLRRSGRIGVSRQLPPGFLDVDVNSLGDVSPKTLEKRFHEKPARYGILA